MDFVWFGLASSESRIAGERVVSALTQRGALFCSALSAGVTASSESQWDSGPPSLSASDPLGLLSSRKQSPHFSFVMLTRWNKTHTLWRCDASVLLANNTSCDASHGKRAPTTTDGASAVKHAISSLQQASISNNDRSNRRCS